MEPVSTTAAISMVVGYLAKRLEDNKSIQIFFDDFVEATVNWIKPLLIKDDGSPEKALQDLKEKPGSSAKQDVVRSLIVSAIEDDPSVEKKLQEMAAVIENKKNKGEAVIITNSSRINMGTIHADGNVTFGDNNNINK